MLPNKPSVKSLQGALMINVTELYYSPYIQLTLKKKNYLNFAKKNSCIVQLRNWGCFSYSVGNKLCFKVYITLGFFTA